MIEIAIPGRADLRLSHLVLDYNGTVAWDGELIRGVSERIIDLSKDLSVHVVTADTFGGVKERLEGLPLTVHVLPPGRQSEAKLEYVRGLGPDGCAAVGNGGNDRLMLEEAALGIAVVEGEGAAVETLLAADVAAPDILSALELLLNPLRLRATLRV